MDVGIFIIATGKYIDFAHNISSDIYKYFLPEVYKRVYLFTDSAVRIDTCITVKTKHKPWPYPTLYRYHIIRDFCKKNGIKHDYYYYLDVDMRIVDVVGKEILGGLIATLHPGFYNKPKSVCPFGNAFLSHSYTPFNIAKNYYAGAVNGGSKYLDMAETICKWIDMDSENGFVPQWHDETYLNKYLAYNPPDVSLDPSYCYPDNIIHSQYWGIQRMKPKIICLTKEDSYVNGRDSV